MKLKYNIAMWCMAAGLFPLAGCSDEEDTWTPGPESQVAYQVYFTEENPTTVELEPGDSYSYNLTLSREESSEAADVPLVASGDTDLFEVPTSVHFDAGQEQTVVTVNFKGAENSEEYVCSLGIPEGTYNSAYTSLTTSIDIHVEVAKWVLYVQNVHFTDNDGWPASLIPDFHCDLMKVEGKEKYRFVNFMGAGIDLSFTLKENEDYDSYYFMQPIGGSYGTEYYGSDAWFFDTNAGEDSFPIYPAEGFAGQYLDWCFLYVNSGYDTCISFKNRWGDFYGYMEVHDASTGDYLNYEYFYLEFSWSKSDVVGDGN